MFFMCVSCAEPEVTIKQQLRYGFELRAMLYKNTERDRERERWGGVTVTVVFYSFLTCAPNSGGREWLHIHDMILCTVPYAMLFPFRLICICHTIGIRDERRVEDEREEKNITSHNHHTYTHTHTHKPHVVRSNAFWMDDDDNNDDDDDDTDAALWFMFMFRVVYDTATRLANDYDDSLGGIHRRLLASRHIRSMWPMSPPMRMTG